MEAKKSKKLVVTILIIATILGAASIGAAYYFNNVENLSRTDSSATEGCGCYYIDTTSDITSCADASAKNTFEYKVGTKDSDGSCSTTCDLRLAPETTGGEDAEIISCNSTAISATPGCLNLSVENSSGQKITDSISLDEEVSIKAYFKPRSVVEDSDPYTNFSFVINGERTEITSSEATITGEGIDAIYEINTKYSDYGDAEKLSVQAFGNGPLASDISSEACIRELDITQTSEASCNVLDADIDISGTDLTVNEVTMNASAISDAETITAVFTLGKDNIKLTTGDLKQYYSNGTIILSSEYLLTSSNFIEDKTFDVLTIGTDDTITLSAEVYTDGTAISSSACTASYDANTDNTSDITQQDTDETTDSDLVDDTDNTDETVDPTQDDGKEQGDTSDFSVTKTGVPQCLERETPNNQASYTITIANNDSTYEDLQTIVDKLPLGFTYVAGSSTINGTAVADADYVTVATVGSAQQITWSATNNWSVAAGDTLTITFSALVNTDALTGDNMNEVVITPVNTPVDPNTLRTEATQEVSQNCSTPETGMFDSLAGRVISAMIVIMLAFAFYYTNTGTSTSLKIASSGTYKALELFGLRITDSKKYFEEKIRRETDK